MFAKRMWILPIAALVIFSILIYYSFLHYEFWVSGDFTKILASDNSVSEELKSLNLGFLDNFLSAVFKNLNGFIKYIFPSYVGGEYLLFFLLTRLWGEHFISLIFSVVFLWATLKLNKKYEERFFYGEEPYFGAVAIFLSGWPGWLYYLIALISIFLIFNFAGTVRANFRKSHSEAQAEESVPERFFTSFRMTQMAQRFSLYYFWLPIAIVIIVVMYYFKLDLPYYYLLKI